MLAQSEDILDALLRRVGVVRVKEAQDLYNMASVLYSKNLPKGQRLAIITNAPGAGFMAANRLLRSGGQLAQLSAETLAALDQFLPASWKRRNPIDIMWTANAERYEKTIRICLHDPGVDGILVIYGLMDVIDSEALANLYRFLCQRVVKNRHRHLAGKGAD